MEVTYARFKYFNYKDNCPKCGKEYSVDGGSFDYEPGKTREHHFYCEGCGHEWAFDSEIVVEIKTNGR